MSQFQAVVDEQSKSLQQEFQLAISEEKYPHGPAVFLSNTSVKVGIWLDERISLVESAIDLTDQWGDNPAYQYSAQMVVRFASADLAELKDNQPGAEIPKQVKVCLDALHKHGRGLLAGDKDGFEQLRFFARGYNCRYTEEMSKGRPATVAIRPSKRNGWRSALLFVVLGAAITAAAMTYWAGYLCRIAHG